jgi:leucyl aminopeptidase
LSSAPIDTTLFLVGKGLTYDTGGADIKYGGSMAGMHRDKCGAAFVAGFFKTLSILKPKGLKVYGTLCMTRNNVGEECYVTDEIITARSGKRIRVGNTDAEGRMAIIDSLCEAREKALNEVNPQLFTIATLTGHVIKCYGTDYTGIMSNGPARELKIDTSLQECGIYICFKLFWTKKNLVFKFEGELISDPYELSRIRREGNLLKCIFLKI